jgi:Aegerolysin
MAEKCHVTGKISCNIPLSLVGAELSWGKWDSNYPVTGVGPGVEIIAFSARGRDSSASGTQGALLYTTPDGTEFKLYFDDPYSADNTCTIAGTGKGTPQLYSYSVDYPASGKEFDAKYTIDLKKPPT